jgi:hypothetical protein
LKPPTKSPPRKKRPAKKGRPKKSFRSVNVDIRYVFPDVFEKFVADLRSGHELLGSAKADVWLVEFAEIYARFAMSVDIGVGYGIAFALIGKLNLVALFDKLFPTIEFEHITVLLF